MDKLKYDSFYKFLVSLGIILITLPFAGLIYIANFKVTLIDEEEYEKLSDYSVSSLEYKQRLYELLDKYFPKMIPLFLILGCLFLLLGGIPWFIMQRELDKQLRSDTKLKENEVLKMASSTEILDKAFREVTEESAENIPLPVDIESLNVETEKTEENQHTETERSDLNKVIKNMRIKEKVCQKLEKDYKKTHCIKSQVKMENFILDAVAIPYKNKKEDDIVFIIKNYDNPQTFEKTFLSKIFDLIDTYKKICNHNCRIVIIVVTPKRNIVVKKSVVSDDEMDTYLYFRRYTHEYKSIEREYWAEEDL